MNELASKALFPKFSSALVAATASGGIYLLAWCYELGYSMYLGLPWQSDVSLSRYCGLFVISALFLSLAYFIPLGDWGDSEQSFRHWKWPTWLRVGGAATLGFGSIGYTLIFRISSETIPVLLVTCAALSGFAFARFALEDKFRLRARVSFAGLVILLLSFSSYLVGSIAPSLKHHWPTFVDDQGNTWIILEHQGGYFITANYNRESSTYSQEFILRDVNESMVIRRERLGQIHPAW